MTDLYRGSRKHAPLCVCLSLSMYIYTHKHISTNFSSSINMSLKMERLICFLFFLFFIGYDSSLVYTFSIYLKFLTETQPCHPIPSRLTFLLHKWHHFDKWQEILQQRHFVHTDYMVIQPTPPTLTYVLQHQNTFKFGHWKKDLFLFNLVRKQSNSYFVIYPASRILGRKQEAQQLFLFLFFSCVLVCGRK